MRKRDTIMKKKLALSLAAITLGSALAVGWQVKAQQTTMTCLPPTVRLGDSCVTPAPTEPEQPTPAPQPATTPIETAPATEVKPQRGCY